MLTMNESMYREVINTGKPIVLMISASWCGPCRQLKPLLKKIEESYKDKIKFYNLDSDECQELCGELHISGIPTLLFIVGSQVRDRLVGVNPENKIIDKIEELLI